MLVKHNHSGTIGCPAKLPWNAFLPARNAAGMKTHVAKKILNNNSSVTTAGDQILVKQNDSGMIACPAQLPWNGFLPIKNASGMKTHVAKHLCNNTPSVTTARNTATIAKKH